MKSEKILITKRSIGYKEGTTLLEYKKVKKGILVNNNDFISDKDFVVLNEALTLTPDDEKKIREMVRTQLKYFFWQLYTKQSIMLNY